MIINDQKLASFKEMIRNFADKNNIRWEMKTDCSKKTTDVTLGNNYSYSYRKYTVTWTDVPNLSEAAAGIFGDAIAKFNLKDTVSSAFVNPVFEIKDVIFSNPATIVLWKDGTKTVVKCQPGDIYEKEVGLALCIAKKALGNKPNFNNVFRKWIPEEEEELVLKDLLINDYGESVSNTTDAINNFYEHVKNFFGGNKND